MSFIPLVDLNRIHQPLLNNFQEAINKVIQENSFVLGNDVENFENEFSSYCGASHAVSVNSGTDALHLALRAAGVSIGDEVITVPFTFVATLEAIKMCGAIPRLVDINEYDLTLDITKLGEAITSKTKAVIAVHIYGQPARMRDIRELCKINGIFLLEDACQAHGAEELGIKAGALGDAAAFSFYPSKNLGAFGDGGMIVTNNAGLANQIRSLRNHGQAELGQKGYSHYISGFCTRLDSIQAAVLRVKLKYLDEWNLQRIKVAEWYHKGLSSLPLKLPLARTGTKHVFYVYAIRSEQRDALKNKLGRLSISTGIHYPQPVHLLPAMSHLGYKQGDFPVAEEAARQTLSIPIFPGITEEEIGQVVDSVNTAMEELSSV